MLCMSKALIPRLIASKAALPLGLTHMKLDSGAWACEVAPSSLRTWPHGMFSYDFIGLIGFHQLTVPVPVANSWPLPSEATKHPPPGQSPRIFSFNPSVNIC